MEEQSPSRLLNSENQVNNSIILIDYVITSFTHK